MSQDIVPLLLSVLFFSVFAEAGDQAGTTLIQEVLGAAVDQLAELVMVEESRIKATRSSINFQNAAMNDLEKDFKELKNKVLLEVQEILTDLGTYALFHIIQQVLMKVSDDRSSRVNVYYGLDVRDRMFAVALRALQDVEAMVQQLVAQCHGTEMEKIRALVSTKFLKLLDIYESEKVVLDKYAGDEAEGQEMISITFVMRKFTARALCMMLQKVAKEGKNLPSYKLIFTFLQGVTVISVFFSSVN